MKRVLFGFVLAVIVAASLPATAALTTVTSPPGAIEAGWNLLTVPAIAINPTPESVFSGFDIDSRLTRWDAVLQGTFTYDAWSPEMFGNVLLGDGYWFESDASGSVSFSALDDNNSMDVWVSLPKAGWALIGNPFNRDFNWPDAKVVDGNVTISLQEAAKTEGWLNSLGYWWDNSAQGLCDIGISDDFPWTETMLSWHGYWIETFVDKIALIFESS